MHAAARNPTHTLSLYTHAHACTAPLTRSLARSRPLPSPPTPPSSTHTHTRWENEISISYSTRSLAKAIVGIAVLLHWLTCFWALLPQLQNDWRNATGLEPAIVECIDDPSACVWPGWGQVIPPHYGVCTACVADDETTSAVCSNPCLTRCEREVLARVMGQQQHYVKMQENWMCRAVADGYLTEAYSSEPFTVYFTSMLVAMLQLVGGVAGVMPSNRDEYIVFTVAIILGTIAFAAVQGVIVQVMTTGDPDEIHFKQQMDALNFMMRDQHVRSRRSLSTQTASMPSFTLSDSHRLLCCAAGSYTQSTSGEGLLSAQQEDAQAQIILCADRSVPL